MRFRALFGETRPLIGMIHLAPLPGSPRWGGSLDRVIDNAVRDARILESAGFDAILVENFGDAPYFPATVPPETVASLTAAVRAVRGACALPAGVNVLRNDARAALAIAAATGAQFIRVNVHVGVMATDQGVIEGRAYETLRARAALGSETAILADVLVKHAVPVGPADLALVAADTARRGLADALLVSGAATGRPADPGQVQQVREAVPDVPVLVASGVTVESVARLLSLADGVIVGTALKRGGATDAPVDPARARAFVRAARAGLKTRAAATKGAARARRSPQALST